MKEQSSLEKVNDVLDHLPLSFKHLEAEIDVLRVSHQKISQENEFLSIDHRAIYNELKEMHEKLFQFNIEIQKLANCFEVFVSSLENSEAS